MSDYSISSTITADDSGFQKAITDVIAGLEGFGDAFSSMTNETKQSFANLANQFTAIDAKAKVWGNSTHIVADKQKALKNEINRLIDSGIKPESQQIQDLKKSYDELGTSGVKSGSSIASSFASLRDVMQGPIAAMQLAKQALDGVWEATIGNASKLEDMEAAFTPLVGGAANAKLMIQALNREAATTPFELTDIGDVSKQLLPVLGNDIKAVTETFRMLGDTAGGNVQKLDSITRGYVKTLNSGKVSLEALNMISDAGVPIIKELSNSMGVTSAELYKMVSAGGVASSELTKTFQKMTSEGGIFFNGMDIASQTLSGKLSTMADSFKTAGAAIGTIFLPVIKSIVTVISNVVGGFGKWATENDNLKNTLKDVAIAVATIATAIAAYTVIANASAIATAAMSVATKAATIATKAAAAAQSLLNIAMNANPVGIVVAGLALLVGAIVIVADKLGGWKMLLLETQKIALIVVRAIMDAFSGLANFYLGILNGLITAFNKISTVLGGKPIKLFDKVDTAVATGIEGKITEINDAIRKEKEEQARLAIQNDKTTKTLKENAEDTADVVEASSKSSIEWANKAAEASIKVLEEERKAVVKSAEDKKQSAKDVHDIRKSYDDKILAIYVDNIEKQRKTSIDDLKEEEKTAETIAAINKTYDDKITAYKADQLNKRNDDDKKYTDDVEKLAKERYSFESDWSKKTINNKIADIQDEKNSALERAATLKASAETTAQIEDYYSKETVKAYGSAAQSIIGSFNSLASAIASTMDAVSAAAVKSVGNISLALAGVVATGGTNLASWVGVATAAITAFLDFTNAGSEEAKKKSAEILKAQQEIASELKKEAEAATKSAQDSADKLESTYKEMVAEIAKDAKEAAGTLGNIFKTGDSRYSGLGKDVVAYYKSLNDSAQKAVQDAKDNGAALKAANLAAVKSSYDVMVDAQKKYNDKYAAFQDVIKSLTTQQVTGVQAQARDRLLAQISEQWGKELEALKNGADSAATIYSAALSKLETDAQQNAVEVDARMKEAAKASYIYGKVFADGATSETLTIQEAWANALSSVYDTYGEGSEQVAKVNEYYSDLVYRALYPVAAALADNNAVLKKNISLWKDASKATIAFQTQLSSLTKAASSVYEAFGNIGTDIASSLVDGLSKGLGESDFMKTMKEYITKIVVQTAVYTDSLMTQMASIGTEIANAVSSGVSTANMSGIVAKLKTLYAQATANAAAATAVVSQAFSGYATGTSSAQAGYHWVGERGRELMYTPGGSTVYNNNETNNIIGALAGGGSRGSNVTLAPVFNSPKAMNQSEQMRALKQYQKSLAFKGVI